MENKRDYTCFNHISDILYDFKEKLSDKEYLEIYNALQSIRLQNYDDKQFYVCTIIRQIQKLKSSGDTSVIMNPAYITMYTSQEQCRKIETEIKRFGFSEVHKKSLLYSNIDIIENIVILKIRSTNKNYESGIIIL